MARDPVPACARHPKRHVVRDGFNGSDGPGRFRRQRFRCTSRQGRFHRFVEPLPRRVLRVQVECDECERTVPVREGPRTSRRDQFSVTEVAKTLSAVGGGLSYRQASMAIRRGIRRGRRGGAKRGPSPTPSQQPHLVEDWVEVYGPVLTAPVAETHWPEVLEVDELSFNLNSGPLQLGGIAAFTILAARGHPQGEPSRIWLLRSFPKRGTALDWERFFHTCQGRPQLIVCDGSRAIRTGIANAFAGLPAVAVRISHYHLGVILERKLGTYHPLRARAGSALRSIQEYDALHADLDPRNPADRAAWRWLTNNRPMISGQLAGPIVGPLSTGALESSLRELKGWLDHRRGSFRNQERTDRLLALMREQLNHTADVGRYRRELTAYLVANQGSPTLPHREVRYSAGMGTLR